MSALVSFVIIIYYVVSLSYMAYVFKKYRVCPELLWCLMQLLMFFGITHFVDQQYDSDQELLWVYLLGLISYILSCSFWKAITKPRVQMTITSQTEKYYARKPYLVFILTVSIALCSLFFMRAGGNVFINGLKAMLSGSNYSMKYSRMGVLSISGVGYIYQLRVTIIPLLVFYYVMIKKKSLISYVLIAIMLVFVIGTGQRGGLASVMAIALITAYYWMSNSNESKGIKPIRKIYVYIVIFGISSALFGRSTVMNGRVASGNSIFAAILKRFLEDNQSCAVVGFRYIKSLPIQYGMDWLRQLADILPGSNSYISLDTRIFAYIYGGSTAGTSPACIWGSAYYNFGILGVPFLAFIIGGVNTKIHAVFSKKECDEFAVIIYSALQFLIAYWVASGPVVLFNNGFIATILLYFLFMLALRVRIVFGNKYSKLSRRYLK